MASDTDQEQIEATSRGRRCSRTSVTPGAIAESVPGGALDPLDDEHLDTLRVGVELRPELLPQRREERWCTTKTKRPGPPGLGPHGTGAGQAAGGASGGTAPRPAHTTVERLRLLGRCEQEHSQNQAAATGMVRAPNMAQTAVPRQQRAHVPEVIPSAANAASPR